MAKKPDEKKVVEETKPEMPNPEMGQEVDPWEAEKDQQIKDLQLRLETVVGYCEDFQKSMGIMQTQVNANKKDISMIRSKPEQINPDAEPGDEERGFECESISQPGVPVTLNVKGRQVTKYK